MQLLIAVAIVAAFFLFRSKQGAGRSGPQPSGPGSSGDSGAAPYSDQLDNFAQAISQFEGINPAYNNPGALKYNTAQSIFPGLAVGQTGNGFAQFGDQGDGWDALNGYIAQNAAAHPSWDFYDFFQHYLGQPLGGPSVTDQGNSDAYAEYVAGYLGVDPTTPLSTALYGG